MRPVPPLAKSKIDNHTYVYYFTIYHAGCNNETGADIVFVLDGSGSIAASNFVKIKNFVKDVINDFEVGSDKNRFGVIQYRYVVTFPLMEVISWVGSGSQPIVVEFQKKMCILINILMNIF